MIKMNKKHAVLPLILLMFCMGVTFNPFTCKTTIYGNIMDGGEIPIENAVVSINVEGVDSVTTTGNGEYRFENVPFGSHEITVTCDGYVDTTEQVSASYLDTAFGCADIKDEETDIILFMVGEGICSNWEELGGSATGNGISGTDDSCYYKSLKINSLGNPVVAWQNGSGGGGSDDGGYDGWNDIYVKQWNGSSWEELGGSATGGGISNTQYGSDRPSLAINGSGNPVVVWGKCNDWYGSGTYDIYLKQWNGSSWEELGGSATGNGISGTVKAEYPSLAINDSGYPVVAWNTCENNCKIIYIKQWNGSSWEEIGTGSASGNGIGSGVTNSLAIDNSGNPVVAWEHRSGSSLPDIYVRRWNGNSWEEVGTGSASGRGIDNNPYWSSWPSLAINNSGNPVVAWSDSTIDAPDIFLKQYVP